MRGKLLLSVMIGVVVGGVTFSKVGGAALGRFPGLNCHQQNPGQTWATNQGLFVYFGAALRQNRPGTIVDALCPYNESGSSKSDVGTLYVDISQELAGDVTASACSQPWAGGSAHCGAATSSPWPGDTTIIIDETALSDGWGTSFSGDYGYLTVSLNWDLDHGPSFVRGYEAD